jgi:hypothetical protein
LFLDFVQNSSSSFFILRKIQLQKLWCSCFCFLFFSLFSYKNFTIDSTTFVRKLKNLKQKYLFSINENFSMAIFKFSSKFTYCSSRNFCFVFFICLFYSVIFFCFIVLHFQNTGVYNFTNLCLRWSFGVSNSPKKNPNPDLPSKF